MTFPSESSLFALDRAVYNSTKFISEGSKFQELHNVSNYNSDVPTASPTTLCRVSRSSSSHESSCGSALTAVPAFSRSSSSSDFHDSNIEDMLMKLNLNITRAPLDFNEYDHFVGSPSMLLNCSNDVDTSPKMYASSVNYPQRAIGFGSMGQPVYDQALKECQIPSSITGLEIPQQPYQYPQLDENIQDVGRKSTPSTAVIGILSVLTGIEAVLKSTPRGLANVTVLEDCLRRHFPHESEMLATIGGIEQLAALAPHRVSVAVAPNSSELIAYLPLTPSLLYDAPPAIRRSSISDSSSRSPPHRNNSDVHKKVYISPDKIAPINMLEKMVVKEAIEILGSAAVWSLKAVELANTLRARLGADALARVRDLRGGLLSMLERHPFIFRVERIPKSDRVTLLQRPPSQVLHRQDETIGAKSAMRCIHVENIPPYMTDDDILLCIRSCGSFQRSKIVVQQGCRSIFVTYFTPYDAACAQKRVTSHPAWCSYVSTVQCDGHCEKNIGKEIRRGNSWQSLPDAVPPFSESTGSRPRSSTGPEFCNSVRIPVTLSSEASVVLSALTSDRFVPTQAWPTNASRDWPFVEATIDLLRGLGGCTTISKLRGLMRTRLDSALTIKSVPLKALIVAYPTSFTLVGNRVSLI